LKDLSGYMHGIHKEMARVVPFLLLSLMLLGSPAYSAVDKEGDSLAALLKDAREKNKQIAAAALQAQRYKTRIPLIENLTDPILSFYYLDFPIGNISSGWTAAENQEKADPGKLVKFRARNRRESILTGLDMVEEQANWYKFLHQDQILKVSSEVRQNFYRLHYLKKIIVVSEQSLATLDGLIETSSASYGVGRVTQQKVLRAQGERYQLQAELIRLRQEQIDLETRLNYLAGRYAKQALNTRLELEFDSRNLPPLQYKVINLISGLYRNNPLLQGYQALGGRFKAMRGMVQMYFNREVRDEAMFEADSGYDAIAATGADYYNDLLAKLNSTASDLGTNRELAGLYERVIVPQRHQLFEAALADLQVGREDYALVLNALLDLNRDQIRYLQALRDYMVDLALLEEYSGLPLNPER